MDVGGSGGVFASGRWTAAASDRSSGVGRGARVPSQMPLLQDDRAVYVRSSGSRSSDSRRDYNSVSVLTLSYNETGS